MASLPARPAVSQRRSSPEQPASQQSHTQSSTSPPGASSEDSTTLFLNNSAQGATLPSQDSDSHASPSSLQQQADADAEIKKCWICFSDSTEDAPDTSPWRNPCPCALVAHEECLLDWIADIEAPNKSRARSGMTAPKIECPQCKSEIRLARPRNLVVEAVRSIERMGAQLVTPGALTVLCGTLYHSSMAWGVHSVYAIFGAEDGTRILSPLILQRARPPIELNGATARQVGEQALGAVLDHIVHWRLYIGLPLITPVLVLSRTSLADTLLPILPILFFATQTHGPNDVLDFGQWPPSASLAFAVLPYVRSAYNMYYKRVWAERENRWLNEIQPRAGSSPGDGEAGMDNQAPVGHGRQDDENVFEIRVDGGIWEDWEDEDQIRNEANEERPQQQQQAPHEQAEDQADPPPDIPNMPNMPDIPNDRAAQQPPAQNPQQQAAQAAAPAGGERRLSFSPTAIAETMLGALVFPSIASLSGELLKLALPRSWTAPAAVATSSKAISGGLRVPARGLLQEKWGRSIVGGCLFVVLKDAVMLYVRWKMAHLHRQRHVLDYDATKRKGRR